MRICVLLATAAPLACYLLGASPQGRLETVGPSARTALRHTGRRHRARIHGRTLHTRGEDTTHTGMGHGLCENKLRSQQKELLRS